MPSDVVERLDLNPNEAPEPYSVGADQVAGLRAAGAQLLDVREVAECALAPVSGALHIPLSTLDTGAAALDPSRPLLVLCASGVRAREAARRLRAQGLREVRVVSGGLHALRALDLPHDPQGDAFAQRYARHLSLAQIGSAGQARLAAARVLLIGAGGLGAPVALYLTAAGVGALRIVDPDRVELGNLQRQILYSEAQIGSAKVSAAREALMARNAQLKLDTVETCLDADNAAALLDGCDVVIDGSDNLPTREQVNRACVVAGVPWVYAAIERFSGQAAVFAARMPDGSASACYACVFGRSEGGQEPPSCAEVGVLGVLPGLLGCIQATEALKLLLGIGEPLRARMLHVDALTMRFRQSALVRDPDCAVCGSGQGGGQ